MRDLFTWPTIAELAAFLHQNPHTTAAESIPKVPEASDFPASPAQLRGILAEMGGSAAYNMAGGIQVEGALNPGALQQAFNALLRRYEILRTSFVEIDWELRQRVHAFEPVLCPVLDLRSCPDQQAELGRYAREHANAVHNLSVPPLLKISVLQLGEARHVLLINMHHLISDGWSMDVVIADFMRLYTDAEAGRSIRADPAPLQYRDCVAWIAQRRRKQEQTNREYWLSQLLPLPDPLQLQADAPRPAVKTYNGSYISMTVLPATERGLRALCQDRGISMAMVLTALVNVLLHRYSGQEDICVGWPVAGRPHPDLESQIGLFVNTVVLRSRLTSDEPFDQYLERVRTAALGALTHEDYPFDQLVQDLNPRPDPSRNPLFDVMVAVQNTAGVTLQLPGLKISSLGSEAASAQFHPPWNFTDLKDGLFLELRFNSDLFHRQTIDGMLRHWATLARRASAAPGTTIGRLPLLTREERARLTAAVPSRDIRPRARKSGRVV